MAEAEVQVGSASVEAPRGFHGTRVDEKGRLKLPAAVAQFLTALGEQKVFITTLDVTTARIYPISVWKQNEAFFEEPGEDAQEKEDLSLIANHFGADCELDGQGRVLVPTELRRTLKMESEQVWLRCYKGRIDVFSKEVYDQKMAQATEGLQEKMQRLQKKGLR